MNLKNRYFLMRHGESEANVANLIVSDPVLGRGKYGLTERGRAQARYSAERSGLDSRTVIVASDFLRARQTAEIAQSVLWISRYCLEPGLRERGFGELNGEQSERYKEVWKLDSLSPENSVFGAESPSRLASRLHQTLERLEMRYSEETVLLVSHGDTLRFLQLVAAELPLTEHMSLEHFSPAEIRALEVRPEARTVPSDGHSGRTESGDFT